VIVHWPLPFVFGPAFVQVPVAAVGSVAPLDVVSVTVTCSFAAGPKPEPLSFSSVTVKVCGWPTSFVALGAIEIRALTHVLFAGPEFWPEPFVVGAGLVVFAMVLENLQSLLPVRPNSLRGGVV